MSFSKKDPGAENTACPDDPSGEDLFADGDPGPSVPPWERLTGAVRLTDVRPTRRGRMALFYRDAEGEEQFLFSVDAETAARLHLEPGAVPDTWTLREAHGQSDLRQAKDKALAYLAVRSYAERELYEKLCRRFDEETSAAAVAEMRRLQLLDDAAFAEQRAAVMARRGKSRREIDRALAQLGIVREQREAALTALPEEEEETLRRLVEKQYLSKLAAGKHDAVAAALARRGYGGSSIRRVLRQVEQEQQADTEE